MNEKSNMIPKKPKRCKKCEKVLKNLGTPNKSGYCSACGQKISKKKWLDNRTDEQIFKMNFRSALYFYRKKNEELFNKIIKEFAEKGKK